MIVAAPARRRGAPAGPSRRDDQRADIQALRAIAVVSVMLFHLWPNRLSGGYVGVDVFFAISGFLITSHLLHEIDATGSLRPARFWARRAKRLVPASALVLMVTAIAVVAVVPRYLWRQFLHEVIWSTLQAENWVLAHNSVDYLASHNAPSPTQHFWTLSAEEQFYFALPLLLLGATLIARYLGLPRRRAVLVTLLGAVGLSLGYSIWLTSTTPSVAYFSTFTRAWEFGAGALIGFMGASRRPHHVLPLVGVGAIAVACIEFGAGTPFPGIAAALPVLGAVLVIWSGQGSAVDRLGRFGPVALLGRVSYPAYLWHWPLIVLMPYALDHPLVFRDKVFILGLTVLLSWLSTTLIEEPVRFKPRLLGDRRPRTVALWCGSAMAIVVVFASVNAHEQAVRETHNAKLARSVAAKQVRCLGAQAMDPALAPCINHDLAGVLVPDPAGVKADDDNLAACWGSAKVCSLGPATGYHRKIFAVGDSHNNTLIGVYRRIADDNNWRIDVAGNAGCYLTTARQSQTSDAHERGCAGWRQRVAKIADTGGYDAIIVTHSDRDNPVVPPPGQSVEQATVNGLVQAWRALPAVPIIAIRDNPSMTPNTLQCVTSHPGTADSACALPRSVALGFFDGQKEAASQVPNAHFVDLSSLYCTRTVCSPVIGHVLVYRDASHITATYAATLSPYLERDIVRLLHA